MPGPQRIPRPPGARRGNPPPWARLAPADRQGIRLGEVVTALAHVGPSDRFPSLPYHARPAAVLVPLFEEDGETRVVLTRRAAHMRSHTSEVAFPGGRLEEGEAALSAALREASEEVGLDPAAVEIVGELPPLATLSSRSGVMPFVGTLASRPHLHPNPHEVAHVFDVALADLVADGVYHEELWTMPAPTDDPAAPADEGEAPVADRPVHFFDLPHDVVWGATARILHGLLELVLVTGRTAPPGSARRPAREGTTPPAPA